MGGKLVIPFKKKILNHKNLYIANFTKNPNMGFLIFIHGGPGYNCGVVEYLIEHDNFFSLLDYNIILYDQRNCGRSKIYDENTLHSNNVHDLDEIIEYFESVHEIEIKGLIGHSYGAKLLFDFYKKFDKKIPGIFVSTANSILVPRLNNLKFDLAYLKKTSPTEYKKILQTMDVLTTSKLWELTEELSPIFKENKDRNYLYWANMDMNEKVQKIQDTIGLPIDEKTFMSVRQDLYSSENNFSVDIDSLNIPYLWVNGFHDFIMNGQDFMFSKNEKILTFSRSSHYPHIEENNKFCKVVNDFIQKQRAFV